MSIYDTALKADAVYVDVRTPMEYNMGHVPGSVNIPLDQIPERWKEIKGIGTQPVIFYCRSGNRSGQAVHFLQQQYGIRNIFNGGGLEEVLMLKMH